MRIQYCRKEMGNAPAPNAYDTLDTLWHVSCRSDGGSCDRPARIGRRPATGGPDGRGRPARSPPDLRPGPAIPGRHPISGRDLGRRRAGAGHDAGSRERRASRRILGLRGQARGGRDRPGPPRLPRLGRGRQLRNLQRPHPQGLYYEAQALFQGDLDAWTKWNEILIRQLKAAQQPDGSIRGRFNPTISTSLSLLSLALNYRFLPIYER
jgi:hypothetical protein